MTDIEVLYTQQIRGLPAEARLQLLALIAQDQQCHRPTNGAALANCRDWEKRSGKGLMASGT
jgi:hypothetical protein